MEAVRLIWKFVNPDRYRLLKGSFLLFLGAMAASCTDQKKPPPPLFTLMEHTGINFRNDVKDTKDDNSFLFRNFYNGGGVAMGDLNNDGLTDVFLSSNQGANHLYINKGSFHFEDISGKAGLRMDSMWSTGVTMADINADGWLDIYVCSSGNMPDDRRRNKLYINNHDLSFTESASNYGLDIAGYCTQASFFDYDGDNDLDCFLINNSPIPFSSLEYASMRDVDSSSWMLDKNLKGGGNHLYQNTNGHYSEVTKKAGLHTGLISFGLGVSVGDVNNDSYPDIYVGNDFIEKDYLYINQKNGTFRDELEERIQKISMSSMSADLADINNDGHPEIFTTDMIPDEDYRLKTTGTFDNIDLYLSKQKAGLYHQYVRNCLQLNNGDGSFSEVANYSGVYGTDWSWGAVFLDADNDGYNDIFVCNGIARDVGDLDFLDFFSGEVYARMLATGKRAEMDELLQHIPSTPLSNRVFRNKGNLGFEDVSQNWGLSQLSFSNSVSYADLDNDGDLDLVVNNENGPAFVYRNNQREQNQNHFIAFQLTEKNTNFFAIGSKISVYKNGQVFCREVVPVRGFQASVEYRQTIGLGAHTFIDSVVVTWPDRTTTIYKDLEVNKLHHLKHDGPAQPIIKNENVPAIFTIAPQSFDKHQEDDYVDFYYERNLPQALSRQGPCMATSDVNGDGLEDVYIGGAKFQQGQLYLQTPSRKFVKNEQDVFRLHQEFEDVAVLFFDADGDKDPDLFLGAGGNNMQPGSREMQHRLYINDGKGNFAIDPKAFPVNDMNIASVAANDYDGDGDLDLFVGGRSKPYAYGISPRSYIYQNNGKGSFTDVTEKLSDEIAYLGMVTGSVWADVNGDQKAELIVTGEWMETRIFSFANGHFKPLQNTGLEHLNGWWQCIVAADLNGDGAKDLVIGNAGENFYLRPDKSRLVKLWMSDFDNNGIIDQFLTQAIKGSDMPVFLKREITDQFPFLKKENLRHSEYAKKSISDLFGESLLKRAVVRTFNYCSSIMAMNDGKGHFTIKPLPVHVQLSSVNAICVTDVNLDSREDLVMGGNLFTFQPQFGRLDASYGHVLINRGEKGFDLVQNKQSGLNLRGSVKDIKTIKVGDSRHLLVGQNDAYPVLYQLKGKQ
jgi:hypothetical protein